jgi:hypothetical protein
MFSESFRPNTLRKSIVTAMAVIAVLGASGAKLLSDAGARRCEVREQLAPGGHASPAPACEFNEDLRRTVGNVADLSRLVIPQSVHHTFEA